MAKREAKKAYNTNLAAEFHMMSLLHRAGLDPSLSLGNKKGVDIVIYREGRVADIVEVKGVAERMDWLIGGTGELPSAPNLYYALVCFNRQIMDLTLPPDFWLIPSKLLARKGEHAVAGNEKTVFLRNAHIRKSYEGFKNTLTGLGSVL